MNSLRTTFARFATAVLVAGIPFILPTSLAAQSQVSAGKTIIILDASGSMWGQIKGRPKIEIAREVIADLLSNLDPSLELGLMSYGHREKGNCEDIELLVPPGKVDRASFLKKVMGIIPKGKTPLTDAVEQAAGFLQYEENPANVILVSDGLETCDRDPCVLAGELAAKGIDFRAHIVAFDLTTEESASFRCLADETGGTFLAAQDAATLRDALEIAVEAASTAKVEVMPEPVIESATIKAPAAVPAGSDFEVKWEGPDHTGDFLTIVAKGALESEWGNYSYTRSGSPTQLTAPVDPGLSEVRYISGGKVLGQADIEVTPSEASLEAPAEVVAGSNFEVNWTGPDNGGDYITIVSKGAEEGVYRSYAYTTNGNPSRVRALPDAGEAEVRYVTGQGDRTLASVPIAVLEAEILVQGPEAVEAGAEFTVEWKGPGNSGDFITIVKADADSGDYNSYAYTENSADGKLSITAVETAGDDYEIRYIEGQEKKTMATAPIIVRPVSGSVSGPDTAVAGSEIEITWSGPAFTSYFITVVDKEADIGSYGRYFYTKNEQSPTRLRVPETPGDAEIRFTTAGKNVLASSAIKITAAKAIFRELPEKVAANGKFRVKWDGPDNKGDFVTIVPATAPEGKYASYIYVQNGQDQDITAPALAGDYEVRYVTDQLGKTLGRSSIEVVAE